MQTPFQADCFPLLIGSIPMKDHQAATELVLTYTPEIPLWVQLPVYREEGMIPQFLPGLPCVVKTAESVFVDTEDSRFEAELLAFYEEYLAESTQEVIPASSRFALTRETASGFFVFMDQIRDPSIGFTAVKGQITGPVTFGTGLHDAAGRAVFYNEQLRDASVKLLAMKARWQAQQLKAGGKPVVIFFDEPALAGYGSSAFISITREEITTCFEEVVAAVHEEGAIAGIHVCANADWSLLLDSSTDIVSFDAYTYFDKLVLYGAQLRAFLERGGILAWGIVPTLNAEDIDSETADSLTASWWKKAQEIEKLGIDRSRLIRQSLITPSCGTGSLDLPHATRVLELTRAVSRRIRKEAGFSS
jgi:methionine synthase II (cobalamin-independent)